MRFSRGLVIGAAVVLLAAALAIAIGTMSLNSFIHSAGFKEEVQARASQSLGGPVTIETMDFDILHGVKLRGLATQVSTHAGGQNVKVNVAQVNLTYSLVDLLAFRLRLTGVVLEQPQIVLAMQPAAASESTPAPDTTAPLAVPSTPNPPTSNVTGTTVPFQFVLDRAAVKDGTLTIFGSTGAPGVTLAGINAKANTSGYADGRDVTGMLRVAQATASGLTVTDFESPITYHGNFVEAKPFTADAFKGRLKGDYVADGTTASVLNLNANGVDAGLLTAATSSRSTAHLTGSLDFQSKWRGLETGVLDGEGDVQLAGGRLEGVHMLQEAARLLRTKEVEAPEISRAQTHFLVQGRQVKFIGLQVESPLFKITGDGTAAFDGPLDANLVLVLSRDAMARLPRAAEGSFVAQPDGTGSIAFRVFGTTSDPQTDLPERLLFQNANGKVQNVINKALNKFFR